MRTKKFRLIYFVLALCLCTFAIGFGLYGNRNANVKADVNVELSEKYSVGEALNFSDDLKMQVGSEEYDVTRIYVVFPDGTAHVAENTVLSMVGSYEVVFESTVDGKCVSVKKSFRATGSLISFEGDDSFATYGEMNNNWTEAYKNGLKISLADGDTIKYARPLNLYESDMTDIISMNVLQKDTVADVGQMVIRLTDVYDPSVFIEILYKNDPTADVSVLRASANGGNSVGLNTGSAGVGVTVRGQNLVKDRNGTVINTNWYKNKTEEGKKQGPTWNNFTIYFDNTVKGKPCVSVRQTLEQNKATVALNKMITEFNNADLFAYDFNGFTTGEVWLTLSASSFGNGITHAPIEIGAIAGEYGENLNVSEYEDLTPPTILLDVPETGVKIYAGCPVTVPVPAVYDASGVKGNAANYVVWFNMDSSAPRMISVKNGVFTPNKVGNYTIIYTATDRNGNVATKTVNLYSTTVAQEGKLGVDLDYAPVGARNAGDVLSFRNVSVISLNGEASIEIRITTPSGDTETINVSDDYILRSVGNYKIEYVCSDVIYNCVYTDEFTAADAGQYGFDAEKIIMPEYVIKGAHYSFDHVNLVKYTAGGNVSAEYEAYMISDGGSPVKCDASDAEIVAENTVVFRLVAKNDPSKIIESDELKVVDVNYKVKNNLQFGKYFVGGYDGAKSEGKSYTVFSRNDKSTDSLDFINPLVTEYFSFSFEIPAGTANYSLTIKLRGYNDRDNSVELKLGEDATGSYCETNGSKVRISGKLSGVSTEVRYSAEGSETYFYVVNGNGVDERVRIGKSVSDTSCLFGLTTDGVDEFYVYGVSNQSFSSINNFDDKTDPYLVVEKAEPVATFGSVFTTCIPVSGDVLTPALTKNCTLTVYFGDDIYTSPIGTEFINLPVNRVYDVTFDKYGEYVFVYRFVDGKGNSVDASFLVNVIDDISPVITIQGKTEINAKIGETVTPPLYTVTDNCSAAENITVSVIVYNERGMLVSASRIDKNSNGSYTFKQAGKYTVYLYCMDETGNFAFAAYTVNVR